MNTQSEIIMENKSYLTAIPRRYPSKPLMILIAQGLIQGHILDYGSGRGKDYETMLKAGLNVERYDSFYFPIIPKGLFNTILCTYVLNVVEQSERQEILNHIDSLLEQQGTAYITVTRWCKTPKWTSKGTFQDFVELDLPIIFEDKSLCIYKYQKK